MAQAASGRVEWVDYAKGICIILVVMMHSTLGVEKALGAASWLHPFIEWARPFRMPDFFMISGLFLASRINRPWSQYLDSKVWHFAYFYALWLTISFALKFTSFAGEMGTAGALGYYALSFVQPFGTLWFIYMLPVFFIVTKLARLVSPILVWFVAAALQVLPVHTGWLVIDEFAERYVYFFTGYWFAAWIFEYARLLDRQRWRTVLSGLVIWAVLNGWLVGAGIAHWPLIGLALGFIGACAVVASGTLLARAHLADPVRYCGQNSIVIYLSFFVFMATMRTVLIKTGLIADAGLISLVVTATGVVGPVLLFWTVRNTPARLLFNRPQMFRYRPPQTPPLPGLARPHSTQH